MSDLISRQAAILQLSHNKCGNDENDIAVQHDIETIRKLSPAQPCKNLSRNHKKGEGCVMDLISRQAAIDALFELYEYQRYIDPTEAADLVRQGVYLAEKKIEQLPSAQTEQDG